MKRYNCPNPNEGIKTQKLLSFLELIEVRFSGLSFAMKGIHSKNSVIVIPFRKVGKTYEIGIIKEERLLFHAGWLSAFPAGKIEDEQSPEEAAQLELWQEGGLQPDKLIFIGSDMPFLHICDETVYSFVALVEEGQDKQSLEEGEMISSEITWMNWQDFQSAIKEQQRGGKAILPGAPMWGVSQIVANKMLALGVNPEELFN